MWRSDVYLFKTFMSFSLHPLWSNLKLHLDLHRSTKLSRWKVFNRWHTRAVVSNSIYSCVRKYCLRQIIDLAVQLKWQDQKSPMPPKTNKQKKTPKTNSCRLPPPTELRSCATSLLENMFGHVGEYHHYYKELLSIIHKSFHFLLFK